MHESFFAADAAETEKIGAAFAGRLKPGDFVALRGDLGAGKTTFVRGVASVLCPGEPVSSPTFAIVNEYEGDIPLIHMDAYRLTGEDDLSSVGYDDYLGRDAVMLVEWSENLPELPENHYTVTLTPERGGRRIEIERVTA